MQCQARTKKGGECRSKAVNGFKVCRIHGGASHPGGPGHPTWKHGRRSRYVPTRLAEKYTEAMEDDRLMEFRADIAILEARLCELLATGESLPLWDRTQDAFHDLRQGMRDADTAAIPLHLSQLESLIHRGMADALRWAEVYKVT